MDKYVKYENKILRVIRNFVGQKDTIALASLEDKNNLYIVNLTDVEELSVEEHEIISVLDR